MERVIDPVSVDLLKAELTPEKKLCDTNKAGNEVYVVDCNDAPNVLQEIGRLRELAFRASGGGTGCSVDLDDFDFLPDRLYKQMVIWDPESCTILGGYRFILGSDVSFDEQGQPILTSSHLFHFSDTFIRDYLPHTIELGRSFVTPEYQSSKAGAKIIFALDNLWDGLAAIMLQHSNMLYYFGKMTIYPHYDKTALALIQHFLWKHFPDPDELVRPNHPYVCGGDGRLMDLILRDADFKGDYRNLKDAVRRLGVNIPPLVNSYMNISPAMKMFGCAINDEFFDAIETGILIGFDEMYADKRDRHKEPYLKNLAKKMRSRFPEMAKATDEVVEKLAEKKEGDRVRRFNAFLNRQKEQVIEAEKNLRKKVQRKKKKEKVEP
ncbi:MAG: GNAT family N-acetyltransferase [Bacteroidales bacterium]|nr:GNAT family N-acetyltransferase [Bacteroidales bacterium]